MLKYIVEFYHVYLAKRIGRGRERPLWPLKRTPKCHEICVQCRTTWDNDFPQITDASFSFLHFPLLRLHQQHAGHLEVHRNYRVQPATRKLRPPKKSRNNSSLWIMPRLPRKDPLLGLDWKLDTRKDFFTSNWVPERPLRPQSTRCQEYRKTPTNFKKSWPGLRYPVFKNYDWL